MLHVRVQTRPLQFEALESLPSRWERRKRSRPPFGHWWPGMDTAGRWGALGGEGSATCSQVRSDVVASFANGGRNHANPHELSEGHTSEAQASERLE